MESLNEKFRPMDGDFPSKLDIIISGSVFFFQDLVRKQDKKRVNDCLLLR